MFCCHSDTDMFPAVLQEYLGTKPQSHIWFKLANYRVFSFFEFKKPLKIETLDIIIIIIIMNYVSSLR